MRVITWVKQRGAEFAEIDLAPGRLWAAGVAVGASPLPYRLEYELECAKRYPHSQSVRARRRRRWRRLELVRDPQGQWLAEAAADGEPHPAGLPSPGGDTSMLDEALDCDLGGSPLTNTMPVLRESLLAGGTAEFVMAWVSVPALQVRAARQRYTFLRRNHSGLGASVIRYHSGAFTADETFDTDGIVIDYPGLGRLA